jgi:hypothetical protein
MSRILFVNSDKVNYRPKRSPAMESKDLVTVVGFDRQAENVWKKQYCELSKDERYKRSKEGEMENRYVIEHFFGWYPNTQRGLVNKSLNLDLSKRYLFAFESELSHVK